MSTWPNREASGGPCEGLNEGESETANTPQLDQTTPV